ncbi:MAG: hypothetical protein M3Q18_10970 [Actinomycetota bacterium]|nr:hypothetical protein [Actinomycetota bacterium]
MTKALWRLAEVAAEIARRQRSGESEITLEGLADQIGDDWRWLAALAEAWDERDHYTDKGWRAKLWEIEAQHIGVMGDE